MTETLQAEQTNHTQRVYNRNASFYDLHEWVVEKLFYRRWRKLLWQQIDGARVLEVGVGTGKNLTFHPQLANMVAIDFSAAMLQRAIARNSRQIPLLMADAQRLSFESGHFDEVVATFVFCSVPDPVLGLQEVRRVLRPGGSVLLLEHQRARWSWLGLCQRWQRPGHALWQRRGRPAGRRTGSRRTRRRQ